MLPLIFLQLGWATPKKEVIHRSTNAVVGPALYGGFGTDLPFEAIGLLGTFEYISHRSFYTELRGSFGYGLGLQTSTEKALTFGFDATLGIPVTRWWRKRYDTMVLMNRESEIVQDSERYLRQKRVVAKVKIPELKYIAPIVRFSGWAGSSTRRWATDDAPGYGFIGSGIRLGYRRDMNVSLPNRGMRARLFSSGHMSLLFLWGPSGEMQWAAQYPFANQSPWGALFEVCGTPTQTKSRPRIGFSIGWLPRAGAAARFDIQWVVGGKTDPY
ncbi:MAG: hypothetical protein VX278_14210 [Myxococcota bacterium]|nr:hypothetical protein [Myxococcota bacterium]